MPKPDPAHKETDKILAEMEKKLHSVYNQAYKEARKTADDFMKQFREADKKKREQVKNGELDKDDYARWRRTQVFQGNRFHKMADTLAADMTNSNKIAASVINGYLPEVYAVNYNYGTYEIEKGSKINTSFTLYDRQTVERLLRDNPDLLPEQARVNIPKDEQWNKKVINSAITQGILQGDSIDKIADRLASSVTDMSQTSAIRNARTMTTSAQNGGRIDSYKRAESMGIKMMQVWLSTLDNRTRHEHILLDGQKRKVGEPFQVDGYKIAFPGDPDAEPFLTYNCRCTLIAEVKGIDYKLSDKEQRDNKLGDMTYEQWKDSKRKQDEGEPDKPKKPEKQPEKPKTPKQAVEAAKNPEEVQDIMKQQGWFSSFVNPQGTTVDNNARIDLSKCDTKSAQSIYNAFDTVFSRYPVLVGKLGGVGIATYTQSEYAYVVGGGTRVYYNPEFYSNYEEFKETYASGVEDHWHPQGTNVDSVTVHEIGHTIDNFLGGKSTTVRNKVLKQMGLKVSDIERNLGRYATKNAREWWADCFAEYMTSENPRPMAEAFGREFEKLMDDLRKKSEGA